MLASLFYVANWRFIVTQQSYAQLFAAPSPVLHFWSLAIEEQFYLVFPLVVAGVLALSRGSRRVLGAVLVVAAAGSLGLMWLLYTPGQDPSRVYYGTGTRAFELLLGALLAIVLSHPAGLVLRIPRWAWVIAGSVGAAVTLALWTCTTQTDVVAVPGRPGRLRRDVVPGHRGGHPARAPSSRCCRSSRCAGWGPSPTAPTSSTGRSSCG